MSAPRRRRSIDEEVCDILNADSTADLRWCDSPIERLMLAALIECRFNTVKSRAGIGVTTLFQQARVATDDGTYKIDFALVRPLPSRSIRLAVELDGYEFHHATRQLVDRDNRRTRALAKRGWTVVRYSGSEITKDAGRCALDAAAIVIDLLDAYERRRR